MRMIDKNLIFVYIKADQLNKFEKNKSFSTPQSKTHESSIWKKKRERREENEIAQVRLELHGFLHRFIENESDQFKARNLHILWLQ